MTRHPWPDTMPVTPEVAAQLYRDVQGDDVPTEPTRSGALVGLVLLLCSAGLVIACAVGVIAMVRP